MSMAEFHPFAMALVITLYDEIRHGDAARVLQQLNAAPGGAVEVRLNSPGGLVSEGLAIYNALRPRKPTVYIDGVVASIASLIAMAGQKVIAAENSLLMIHDPWTDTTGNPSQLRRTADLLDKHLDAMVSAYARSGLKESQLRGLMAAETWMTAEEALDLGFVDEIGEALRYAAHSPAAYAGYHNTPESLMTTTARKGGARAADDPNTGTPGTPDEGGGANEKSLEAFKAGMASDSVAKAAHDAVMEQLKQRQVTIAVTARSLGHHPGVHALAVEAMADPTISLEDFNRQVMACIGRETSPSGGVLHGEGLIYSGRDGTRGTDFVHAASDALVIRAGIRVDRPHAGARDVANMGLQGIARACVDRAGRYSGGKPGEVVRAALSTSDFPAILENTLGKALRAGYESEQQTFTAWTRKVEVPDFKVQSRVILGSAPDLDLVLEGGEYTYGSMDEDKATYKVDKYGKLVRFTWEAMINDDLDSFLRITQAMGLAAARAEADNIYGTFDANSGAGPQMQDGINLFHADHGNLATSASGLDSAALGAGRILLRRQKALGGGMLNLAPRFLLVAPEHEQDAEILLAAASRSISQGSDNALVPAWLAKLELVVEARLDGSAAYLLTSPASIDTLERAWLEADGGPVIRENEGFSVDDKVYKVRHVFGARWLDWRGVVKLPISAEG